MINILNLFSINSSIHLNNIKKISTKLKIKVKIKAFKTRTKEKFKSKSKNNHNKNYLIFMEIF
jgi:hypothetical protein